MRERAECNPDYYLGILLLSVAGSGSGPILPLSRLACHVRLPGRPRPPSRCSRGAELVRLRSAGSALITEATAEERSHHPCNWHFARRVPATRDSGREVPPTVPDPELRRFAAPNRELRPPNPRDSGSAPANPRNSGIGASGISDVSQMANYSQERPIRGVKTGLSRSFRSEVLLHIRFAEICHFAKKVLTRPMNRTYRATNNARLTMRRTSERSSIVAIE